MTCIVVGVFFRIARRTFGSTGPFRMLVRTRSVLWGIHKVAFRCSRSPYSAKAATDGLAGMLVKGVFVWFSASGHTCDLA